MGRIKEEELMNLLERMKRAFSTMSSWKPEEIKQTLLNLDVSLEEVTAFLRDPAGKPYARKVLYQDDHVEVIVMNWSALACAPHDHGQSAGWIQVLSGRTKQTIYRVENDSLPEPLFTETQNKGSCFFAPVRGVHQMAQEGGEPLITLHLYSPPIRGMKVYDLEACAACIVSTDCGAWWPDDQKQKVKEIQLKKKRT
ncbi:cysteine dioxygenase family protein [Halobacillus sp. ACCC02827]|uniref:cysteine dioxygenase n=1 Tax=Bacillaceae TaxID=186817 RepID=UPI0002A515BB|nr:MULTISPECIES: cysteine dioxygenase family protein [Bacillaceae]ELK46285.1 hypothetical protein D479_11311 [Halobacillus sp. BAB-2008]WJE16076.1 cysteine dioxygenase family protein [Halobacillus sp. ACCC02827]